MTEIYSDTSTIPNQRKDAKPKDPLSWIDERWDKLPTSNKVNECIELVYYAIRDALIGGIESAIDDGGEKQLQIEKRIEIFLKGEGKAQEGQISSPGEHDEVDDCILWIILWKAVGSIPDKDNENPENRANMRIVHMVIDIAPWLAFDNPTKSIQVDENQQPLSSWEPYNIRKRCKFGATHDHKDNQWDSTPFHEAAAKNNSEAIDYMLKKGAEKLNLAKPGVSQRQLLIEVLQKPNANEDTALSLSAKQKHGKKKALKTILDFCKESLDPDNKVFQDALDKGRADVVGAFLDANPSGFISPSIVFKAANALKRFEPGNARYQSQESIIGSLISHTATAKDLDEDTLKLIIQLNLKDILRKKLENADFKFDDLNPLHLAVENQSPEFVEMFLEYYPHLITRIRHGKYALWHNNFVADNQRRSPDARTVDNKRIRDVIVTATIRSKEVGKMENLVEIFLLSGGMCISLSGFLLMRNSYQISQSIDVDNYSAENGKLMQFHFIYLVVGTKSHP